VARAPNPLFRFSGRRFFTRFDYDVDNERARVLVNERVSAASPDIVAVTNWESLGPALSPSGGAGKTAGTGAGSGSCP